MRTKIISTMLASTTIETVLKCCFFLFIFQTEKATAVLNSLEKLLYDPAKQATEVLLIGVSPAGFMFSQLF